MFPLLLSAKLRLKTDVESVKRLSAARLTDTWLISTGRFREPLSMPEVWKSCKIFDVDDVATFGSVEDEDAKFRLAESTKLCPFASSLFFEFGSLDISAIPAAVFGGKLEDAFDDCATFSIAASGLLDSPETEDTVRAGWGGSEQSSCVVLVTRATEPRSALTWFGLIPGS